MASVASSFSFANKNGGTDTPDLSGFSSVLSNKTSTTGSTFSSSLSTQPTGTTTTSASSVTGPLKPQITGFAPLKAFKPSSSFGASLLESLPPIPDSVSATTSNNSSTQLSPGGLSSQPAGLGTQRNGFGASNSQPTAFGGVGTGGSGGLGGGLRPQMTGAAANPFRISMMATGGGANYGGGRLPFKSSTLPPFDGGMGAPFQNRTTASFGSSLFGVGTGDGSNFNPGGYDTSKQQQHQNGSASLI